VVAMAFWVLKFVVDVRNFRYFNSSVVDDDNETSFPYGLIMECGIVTIVSKNHKHQNEGFENGRRVFLGK
jgi:hypothetical protein